MEHRNPNLPDRLCRSLHKRHPNPRRFGQTIPTRKHLVECQFPSRELYYLLLAD